MLNILQDYHYHRRKQREESSTKDRESSHLQKRLSHKQTQLLGKEFMTKFGDQRQISVLEEIFRHHKYMGSLSQTQREIVCREAGYMVVPARTKIFEQEFYEDNMYVIVKGRVAIELKSPDFGNMPIVI